MEEARNDLEAKMQKISLVISLVGLGLMVFGFADALFDGASLSLPGMAAVTPPMIMSGKPIAPGLIAMSVGIVVLSLLPLLRVLLALSLYVRYRQVFNVVVALLVFIELLLSVRTGG